MLQPMNYCTHAIEAFEGLIAKIEKSAMQDVSSDIEMFYVDMLQRAMKFMLPAGGRILDDEDYSPNKFDLLNLPFPVCALEFEAGDDRFVPESGLAESNKRIALAFDPHALSAELTRLFVRLIGDSRVFDRLPKKALCVAAVFEVSTQSVPGRMWVGSTGCVAIDLENDRPRPTNTEELDEAFLLAIDPQRRKKPTRHALTAVAYPFVSRMLSAGLTDRSEMDKIVLVDTVDEISVAYNFLAALNCSNVGHQKLPASAKLNAKRVRNGRMPLFDYHVLDIEVISGSRPESKPGMGGAHSSPRTHLRRGHIRRLESRSIWINATVVNPGHSPMLNKDYRIRRT